MPKIVAKTVTIHRSLTDGKVLNIQADFWEIDDDAETTIKPKHLGTKNDLTAADLDELFPNAALAEQIGDLRSKIKELENDHAEAVVKAKSVSEARDILAADVAAREIERAEMQNRLNDQAGALNAVEKQVAMVEPLKEQIRALKGVPKFRAIDLLAKLSDAEKDRITEFVATRETFRQMWAEFLGRVSGAPIAIDSQTFVAALDGLRQVLGEQRVSEVFTEMNIDLAAGAYIDPLKAAQYDSQTVKGQMTP